MTRKKEQAARNKNGARPKSKYGSFLVVYCPECFREGREITQKSCGVKTVVSGEARKATCKHGHSIPVHNRANKYLGH